MTHGCDFGKRLLDQAVGPRRADPDSGTLEPEERFWFMWDELASGAVGVVIVADTRRLADCFPNGLPTRNRLHNTLAGPYATNSRSKFGNK